ncbi:MAG: M16 family metallopeptidase [Thermoanaerobaculia bacterium]
MTSTEASGGLDRSRPPEAAGAARPFVFPAFERRRLSCGTDLLSIHAGNLPLVHLRLLIGAGGHHAPADLPGLPSFMAALMDEGTARRSGPELAAEIERLGGYLGTGAGWDAAVVETEVLVEDLATGLDLMAEVAREPSFPNHEVGRVRRQLQAEIEHRRTDPAAVASEHFARVLYRGTVYDRPLIGTGDSLDRADRDTVVGFHSRHVAAVGATLVAVGDVEPERLYETAETAFSNWLGQTPADPAIEVSPARELRFEIVDRPGAAQTELRVGQIGIPRSDPRFLRASVLSSLFGGKFTSRLMLNLRETRGFTYGVRSSFDKRIGPGPFVISTALANEHVGAALDEVFGELDRLLAEEPDEAEVADTRDYLIGSFPYSVETMRGLAGRLSDLAIYDLADDYYARFPAAVAAVSGADLLDTARELLAPDRSLVVCVGPADELRRDLEDRFEAPVTVVGTDDR